MSTLIAIDPGKKGGICVLRGQEVHAYKMPETPRDMADLIESIQLGAMGGAIDASAPPVIRCFVERVGGYIGSKATSEDGVVTGQPGSAMFAFGAGYGVILGVLAAFKIPHELVTPQTWQKGLGLGTKGLLRPTILPTMDKEARRVEYKRVSTINNRLKVEWKRKLKALAQSLYPNIKVILDTSDCLLLLEYGRRREKVEAAKPQQPALI